MSRPAAVAPFLLALLGSPCLLPSAAAGPQPAGELLFCKRSKAEAGTYLAEAGGEKRQRILFLCGPDVAPRFAPDGHRILFGSPRGGRPWLWMAGRDGQDRTPVCQGEQGTWSPDGSSIFFCRGGRVVRRDLSTGREETVSPPGCNSCSFPDCSPDGKHLLWCAQAGGRTQLLVMAVGGQRPTAIADLHAASPARWSPDGNRIAYSDGASVMVASRDGTWRYSLGPHGGADRCPAWSPDGTMLVYCHAAAPRGGELLCLANADGTAARLLPKGRMFEPGRDGLVRSNPRLAPYEDNVLTVFAPDWRGASAPVNPSAAALVPPPRIRVWEAGRGATPDFAAWPGFFEQRAGWKPVSAATRSPGPLVVENERLIALLGSPRGGAVLCAKPAGKQACIVELVPVSQSGEEARQSQSLTLVHLGVEEAVLELCSSTAAGRTLKTSWRFAGGWPLVRIAGEQDAGGVRIAAPLACAAVPDRLADDLLYDPACYTAPRVALPAAPMSLGFLGAGDAQLVVICPSERQAVDLLTAERGSTSFSGVELRFAGEPVLAGLLAEPGMWHAERPLVRYGRKRIDLAWALPGPGAWRLAVRAGSGDYAEMFDETQSRRLDGARLFITEREEFSGVIQLVLVYLYGGSPGTPPNRLAPADLALRGLGMASFLRAVDIPGLRGYRTAPRETTWADIFATLDSLRYLFDNELEKEEKEFLGHLCDDVPAFLEGMDARLAEFVDFARQAKEQARGTAADRSFLAAVEPALQKLDEACQRKARLADAADAARAAARVKALALQEVADKKATFSSELQRIASAARGRADLVRAFRSAARELSSAAGYSCAERPELRPAASAMRELSRAVLRNRYYFEGDWRGELEREPPNWLGPTPY